MANWSLIDQLDQAVEAILASPDASPPRVDSRIEPLVRLAGDLRDMARDGFKERLKRDLMRRVEMNMSATATASEVNPVRQGFRTVTPYIAVKEAQQVIDFVQNVFGAEGKIYGIGSQGGIHSEFKIGNSMIMIGGGENFKRTPNPAALHVYVENVDAVYERAIEAGATSLYAPTDHEYGERGASVADAGGNHWYIATSQGSNYIPEGADNLMPYLHPKGAPKMINFLKQAFAAEEMFVYQSPDGIVQHAKVHIGNSIVEMGEAHGQWQPMPSQFMLYVDDADAWYARAIQAEGAISVHAPADQPYGDRVGTIKDPFDNTWYLATHIRDMSAPDNQKDDAATVGSSERKQIMAVPKLFRVMLEVGNLDQAVAFYSTLLGVEGRVLRGSRAYFDCGPVILALVDPTAGGIEPKPNSADVYFAVNDLDQIHLRATELKCLSQEDVHGAIAGEIATRPWGERSFYAKDLWNNGLCFVDETTLYTGR